MYTMTHKEHLLSSVSRRALNPPRMTRPQYNAAMTHSGLEMGFLAMVYDPATKKNVLREVGPEYWAEIEKLETVHVTRK